MIIFRAQNFNSVFITLSLLTLVIQGAGCARLTRSQKQGNSALNGASGTHNMGDPGFYKLASQRWQNDFDGDGKADFAYWVPVNGAWVAALSNSQTRFLTNFPPTSLETYGVIPVPGDYDGDGKTDYAVWKPSLGLWQAYLSSRQAVVPLGYLGGVVNEDMDVPVAGDYDGDGKTDLAVWRAETGTWFIRPSGGTGDRQTAWGQRGDVPVPGDYDGDGKTDLAVYRTGEGLWYVMNSSSGQMVTFRLGQPGDYPVPGDYDGDGRTDVAMYTPSTAVWTYLGSRDGALHSVQWGQPGNIAVPGDYDGDGVTDFVVWVPEKTGFQHFEVRYANGGTGSYSVPESQNSPWFVPLSIAAGRYELDNIVAALTQTEDLGQRLKIGFDSGLIVQTQGVVSTVTEHMVDYRDPITGLSVMHTERDMDLSSAWQVKDKVVTCIQPWEKAPVAFLPKDFAAAYYGIPGGVATAFKFKESTLVLNVDVAKAGVTGALLQAATDSTAKNYNEVNTYSGTMGGVQVAGMPPMSTSANGPAGKNVVKVQCNDALCPDTVAPFDCKAWGQTDSTWIMHKGMPTGSKYTIDVACGGIERACGADDACKADYLLTVMQHETGHVLGLGDDYKNRSSVMQAARRNVDPKSAISYVTPVLNQIYNRTVKSVWRNDMCWTKLPNNDGTVGNEGGGSAGNGSEGQGMGGSANPYPPGTNNGFCYVSCPAGWDFDLFTCTCTNVYSVVR